MIKNSIISLGIIIAGYVIELILFGEGLVDSSVVSAYLWAAGLNLINMIIAISIFSYSASKDLNQFVFFTLFSITIRIILIISAILIIIKFININKTAFIFTFFVIYFIFLILEIVYYKHRLTKKNEYVDS
jgi:hypothetical protein